MEKLKNNLIKISQDLSQKDKILKKEYKETDLFKVWRRILAAAPAKFNKSWHNLMVALQTVLKLKYPNPSTFNRMVSKFRKPIKDNVKFVSEIYPQSLILLGRTKEEAVQQKSEYRKKVAERNNNRASYPVLYVEDIFKIMDRLIKSNDPYELVLAVELATGSRSIEVFKVSNYFEIPEQPNQIGIVGIVKNKSILSNTLFTRNLVHLTSDQVLKAVEKIRNNFDFGVKNNDQISNLTNTALNKAFRKNILPLFQPQEEEYLKTLTSHKTRYISAYTSYLIYGLPKKIPEETYIQNQLSLVSAEITRAYLGINIQFRGQANVEQKETEPLVDLNSFKNSHRRTMEAENKINLVVEALKALKKNGVKMGQRDLRAQLGYSGNVLTAGYKKARELGII